MPKRFLLVVAFAALAMASGCGSVNQAFVDGVEASAVKSGLLAEYDAYVDADPKIKDPETRRIRKQSSARLRGLIEEARRNGK